MKIKKITKKISIAVLSFVTCVCSFAGLGSISVNAAETVAISPTALVSLNEKTATATAQSAIYSESTVKGVGLSSEQPYSGQFAMTFGANEAFDLRYRFPNQYTTDSGHTTTAGGDLKGNFKFTIADAVEPERQFVIEISSNGSTCIEYNGYYATTWTRTDLPSSQVNYGGYACGSGPKYNNADETTICNSIFLEWEGDILTVYACNSAKSQGKQLIAQFNDIAYDTSVKYAYGLPKINFPNGYTVSFSSNYEAGLDTDGDGMVDDYGTDVIFTSLNGVELGIESLNSIQNKQEIYAEGEYVENEQPCIATKIGETAEFYLRSNYTYGDWNFNALDKKIDTLPSQMKAGKTFYTVTYNELSLTKTYLHTVKKAFEESDLVSVGEEASLSSVLPYAGAKEKGILISSQNAYTGALKGSFEGDLDLLYRFPNQYAADSGTATTAGGDKNGNFTFTIADVEEPDNIKKQFTLSFTANWANVQVGYNGKYVSTKNNGAPAQFIDGYGNVCFNEPKYNNADETTAYNRLKLVWEGDVLCVYCSNSVKKLSEQLVAKFDGTTAISTESGAYAWGLPKLFFENGYTVSFSSNYEAGLDTDGDTVSDDYGTDVLFIAMNGVNLNEEAVETETIVDIAYEGRYQKYSGLKTDIYVKKGEELTGFSQIYQVVTNGQTSFLDKKVFNVDLSSVDVNTIGNYTVTATIDAYPETYMPLTETFVFHVEDYTLVNLELNGGFYGEEYYYTDNILPDLPVPIREYFDFDGWYTDSAFKNKVETISRGFTGTLYAKWIDLYPPVITLRSGVNEVQAFGLGTNISLSAKDVVAYDESVVGEMPESTISISVKGANDTDFIAFENYQFNELGQYTARYTVTDAAGYSVFLDRIIFIEQGVGPKLTLNGEMPSVGYVGKQIALPSTTVDEGSTVVCIVVVDGAFVTVTDNMIFLEKKGVYTVTYVGTSKLGYRTIKEYSLNVIEDVEGPTINVDFENKQVLKDTLIKVPTATATDAVDGETEVKVSVMFGLTSVTLTNGEFSANEYGTYIITYTATDEYGNTTLRSFYVEVKKDIQTEIGDSNTGNDNSDPNASNQAPNSSSSCNSCKGCGSSIGIGIGGIVLLGMSTYLLLKKRKDNNEIENR